MKKNLKKLSHEIDQPLKFEPPRFVREGKRSNNRIESSTRKIEFLYVMRGYALDLDTEDIIVEAKKQSLEITKAIRIRSRATNSDTLLIGLLTTHRKTFNTLLADGFKIFYRKYLVEESHALQLQPRQCKCQ